MPQVESHVKTKARQCMLCASDCLVSLVSSQPDCQIVESSRLPEEHFRLKRDASGRPFLFPLLSQLRPLVILRCHAET